MKTITIIIMYAILIPGVALYIRRKVKGSNKSGIAVINKGLCTAIILAAGLVGHMHALDTYAVFTILIAAGLAFGLAGDIAICYDFKAGMFFFAIGHFCYISAFLAVSAKLLWVLPVFAATCAVAFAIYRASGMEPGKMLIPLIAYSVILIAMLSLATCVPVGNPGQPTSVIIFTGAFLFTVSDAILALNTFKTRRLRLKRAVRNRLGALSTSCYFLGQSLLAVSTLI